MKDYFFSINKFNKPLEAKNEDAIATLLIRLFLLNPGEIQSHPEMGLGIPKLWRYSKVEDLPELKNQIIHQINTYLPQLVATNVTLDTDPDEKQLIISVSINKIIYKFTTDDDKGITLADL